MGKTEAGSTTHIIRQYAAVNQTISRKKIMKELGFTAKKTDAAVSTLIEQGWLTKISAGVYAFQNKERFHRESPIEDRIWAAMRINPSFTVADIARQAGTTDNYVARKIREYRDAKWVIARGTEPNASGTSRVKKWALTQKGHARIERPVIDVFKPDPLIEKTVKLNKLICTGRVKFNVTDREDALKLIKEIEGHLKEDTNE